MAQSKKSRKRKRRRDNNPKSGANEDGTDHADEQEVESNIADMSIDAESEENSVTSGDASKNNVQDGTSPQVPGTAKTPAVSGKHRAGFDAFMTGYIMASYISEYGCYKGSLNLNDVGLEEIRNLVYLTGKDIALSVVKSGFTKTSKDHREKCSKVRLMST